MSAPLPFVGQKRMFAREFIKVLKTYPENTTFVDLFGGSGLLSHITKCQRPDATVVYNDFDNYRQRLANIPKTNKLLEDLRQIVGDMPRHKIIGKDLKKQILDRIIREEEVYNYVDYITISSSLLFSMKYVTGFDGLEKETLYNNIRKTNYLECKDYLDGLTVTSVDYKKLVNCYNNVPNVVYILDPPYLSTDVSTYKMSWGLTDYLDVLKVLHGHSYIYFTSNKSSIIELCKWIEENKDFDDPFKNCHKIEFNARINYNSTYTDIMLYNNA